jgi:hypothetical protein
MCSVSLIVNTPAPAPIEILTENSRGFEKLASSHCTHFAAMIFPALHSLRNTDFGKSVYFCKTVNLIEYKEAPQLCDAAT